VGVLADPTVQRDDWRGAARAIERGGPAVVVGPENAEVPLGVYLPGARRLRAGEVTARDLAFVSFRERRTGRSSLPPEPARRAPRGFRPAGAPVTDTYAVTRFAAPAPTRVSRRELAAALGDPNAAIVAAPAR
jgi:hypothetical protein